MEDKKTNHCMSWQRGVDAVTRYHDVIQGSVVTYQTESILKVEHFLFAYIFQKIYITLPAIASNFPPSSLFFLTQTSSSAGKPRSFAVWTRGGSLKSGRIMWGRPGPPAHDKEMGISISFSIAEPAPSETLNPIEPPVLHP